MSKFITIGYGDRDGYDRTDAAVRDAAHAHDAQLRKAGTLMGMASTSCAVRNADAKHLDTRTGPFMSSSEAQGRPSRWNTLRALRVLDWYSARD
jgi:hypothetical protein